MVLALLTKAASADVTIGGEVREWFEATQHDAEWLQRARVHADLSLDGVRVFLEPISGLEQGRDVARPSDRDRLDLHTAFVEVGGLRVGRQELAFGSGRLLDTRDGPNIRASYDGARAHVGAIDVFAAREVELRPGVLDDRSGDRALWGAWATHKTAAIIADAYLLGTRRDVALQRASGRELRHTLGARIRLTKNRFAAELEGAVQRGDLDGTPIEAWLVGGEVVADWLTLGGGVTSGDRGRGAIGTFLPLSFRAAYFGYLAPLGPSNEIGIHAAASRALPHGVALRAEVWEFWRESLADGVYSLSGALLPPASGR